MMRCKYPSPMCVTVRFCRRSCRRRSLRYLICLWIVSLLLVLVGLAIVIITFRREIYSLVKCSDETSRLVIDDYCRLYHLGMISGSLCQPLCEAKKIRYQACKDFHAGKEVFILACNDFCQANEEVPAVLKTSAKNITILSVGHGIFLDKLDKNKFVKNMNRIIRNSVNSTFGFVPFPGTADAIEILWEKNYEEYWNNQTGFQAAERTIISLLDQSEYVYAKVLERSGIVPRIYGTCGPLYLQESCPPGPLDPEIISLTYDTVSPTSWTEQAAVIMKLLRLLQQLDHGFSEPLHLCDVKGSNFGVCMDGRVKVIDLDSAFFDTMMTNIMNTSVCQTHEDCYFFDCRGHCNKNLGECFPVKTNNNLYSVCEDMLKSFIPGLSSLVGILSGAPSAVAKELHTVLLECLAQSSVENGIPFNKPSSTTLNKLMELLLKSQGDIS